MIRMRFLWLWWLSWKHWFMLKELKFRIRIGKHDHHLCSQGEQTVPSIVLCITSSSRGPGRLDEVERHRQTPHQDILTPVLTPWRRRLCNHLPESWSVLVLGPQSWSLEGIWWHPLIQKSDLRKYWCCCCCCYCIRTLQERTKQLLPLVITRHSVMIVTLNNKSNSHDYKLSSCNKQKNVALYMCTMHRPLTCTESHHWSPLWWQMALNWSKRSWTAAPESENSTVSHLLKPHKSLEILDLLSNFEIKGQKFSISKLNIGFSPMSGWMGELTSFTWPSSSSSSKPLLWSFHSLPLPDTLIQRRQVENIGCTHVLPQILL